MSVGPSTPDLPQRYDPVYSMPVPPRRRDAIEAAGLAKGDGDSTAARLAASTGTMDDVRRQLGKQFGVEPSTIDVGEQEGVGYIFKNPETGEYEPLNPAGFQLRDLAPGAADLGVLGGEIAGGVLGLRGGPAGAVAGSAAGAGLTRGAILSGLKKLGVIDPSYGDIAMEAGMDAG